MSQATEVIERTWNAPLALIWELWTTPEGIGSWFGPKGFTATVQRIDLVEGGSFDYTMAAVDPKTKAHMESMGRPASWPAHAVITEVSPMTRLCYDLHMPMGPERMAVMTHTIVFTETDEGVHMRMTLGAEMASMLKGAAMGYRSSCERLAALLESRALS